MGLLDQLFGTGGDDPRSQAMGLLGAGLMAGNPAQAFGQANGLFAQASGNALKKKLLEAQLEETLAQADERKTNAQKQRAALDQAAKIRAGIPGLFTQPGMTGGEPQPQTMGGVPMFSQPMGVTPLRQTPGGFDVQGAIALGLDPKQISEYAGLQNIGRQKVARTIKGMGPDGKEYEYQLDESGQRVGDGFAQYRAPISVNQGDRTTFADPYNLRPVGQFKTNQTEDSKASTAVSWANNAATLRGQNMTDARARDAQNADTSLSPEAIINGAARYNMDGSLPPMGMGKAAAMGRSEILNEAARQAAAKGDTPEAQRMAHIANKANSAALGKLQQQQTMVGAFERNFSSNADIVLEMSQKVDRTGIPIANKWINAGKRSVQGDPDLAAFDASVKAVSNEYAKIVSGSMGNTATAEGEIKKMESLLNSAQNTQQVAAVVNMMKRETQNRMKGFEDEKQSLTGAMIGRKPETKPEAAKPKATMRYNPTTKSMEMVN